MGPAETEPPQRPEFYSFYWAPGTLEGFAYCFCETRNGKLKFGL